MSDGLGWSTPLLLGLMLGIQHATDPDHLVAVATIVSHERRFGRGALVGLLWGLGHTAVLLAAGALVVTLRVRIPPWLQAGLEGLVAVALVILGTVRVLTVVRELRAVDRDHLWADHDHGTGAAFHSHPHRHRDGAWHRHPHVHPSPALLRVLTGTRHRMVVSSLAIGALHGLAGTGAAALLVLATFRSPWEGLGYLAAFGTGTLVAMVALTAALAWPVSAAWRFDHLRRAVGVLAGLAAIGVGLRLGISHAQGLWGAVTGEIPQTNFSLHDRHLTTIRSSAT
jgi:high-affinity nickel-transport protein